MEIDREALSELIRLPNDYTSIKTIEKAVSNKQWQNLIYEAMCNCDMGAAFKMFDVMCTDCELTIHKSTVSVGDENAKFTFDDSRRAKSLARACLAMVLYVYDSEI